jgi:hypothetical protein
MPNRRTAPVPTQRSHYYGYPWMPRRAQVGDGLGASRAHALLPITNRDLALQRAIDNDAAYLRLGRRAIVKWHEGLSVIQAVRYRAGWVVEIDRPDGAGSAWIAALDVDHPTSTSTRVRAIGTRLMAFLHATRVGAETTMHRYFYDAAPELGPLGPSSR